MKHKKTVFTFILSIIVFITGCTTKKSEKTTITFAGGGVGVEEEVTREQIKLFEQKHPDINVNYQVMPDSATQRHDIFVTHLSAADSTIDVYMIDIIWPAEFGAADWILPLDKYISKEEKDSFIKSAIEGCTYDNNLYAIPWFVTSGLLYYRQDLLEKEGLEPPADWDELVNHSKLLSKKYNIDGFLWQGAQYEGLICDFLEFVWSNDGEILDANGNVKINSPQVHQALEFMKDTIDKYKISPPGTITYKEEDTRQIFQNGNAAFLRNWPYVWSLVQSKASEIQDKVEIETIPKGYQGKKGIACIGGWNLAISKYSRHPEVAWKFIKFVTSSRQQIYRAIKAGQAPSLLSVYKKPSLIKENPFYTDILKAIKNSRSRLQTPFYSDISEIMQIYVSKALSGQISIKEALSKAEKEIKNILNRAK